ncbi:MAG: helix-turn-helix domain-containing protein [Deltaproteobacteria bacterium]|nr:helix-turn-helix domain-containing protein [Deltaproteobacteria bacterium]
MDKDLFSIAVEKVAEVKPTIREVKPDENLDDNVTQIGFFSGGDRFYTCKEVSSMFSVSEQTVYKWIYSGKLEDVVVSGRRMIPEYRLNKFKELYIDENRSNVRRKPVKEAL